MSLVTIHYNKKSFQSYSWINQMMLHKILFKVAAILHSLSIFRSALILLIQFVLFSFFVVTSTGSLFLFLTFSYFFYFSLPFFLHICLFYFYPYFVFFFFFLEIVQILFINLNLSSFICVQLPELVWCNIC